MTIRDALGNALMHAHAAGLGRPQARRERAATTARGTGRLFRTLPLHRGAALRHSGQALGRWWRARLRRADGRPRSR